MLEVIIKYFTLMVCSFYIYLKILNIKLPKITYLQYILFLLIILPAVYVLRKIIAPLNLIVAFSFFTIFMLKKTKIPPNLSITTSVLSFGFSYMFLLISTLLVCTIEFLITTSTQNNYHADIYTLIFVNIVQLLLVILPFKQKRFRNGMPFIVEHGKSDFGVYISITLLIAASFLGMNKDTDLVYMIPIFFSAFSGLVVLFWWRSSITKKYLEKVKALEIQALQDNLYTQNEETKKLQQHNDALSKIIHKDNKLIPALEYAVRQYLLSAELEDDIEQLEKGRLLLSQIENISSERRGIIASYEANSKRFPATGVPSVDSLLIYMFHKSKQHQIDFNVTLSGSVKYLIENIASEHDINTLLADLIENAIIATKKCTLKNILVHIGISDNCYTINIFDSGIPFTPETKSELGLNRTTTHRSEGGSGIGLMTAFEILRKYGASFVIEDINDNALYTKSVSVLFDNLSQYRIVSDNEKITDLPSSPNYIGLDRWQRGSVHKRQ